MAIKKESERDRGYWEAFVKLNGKMPYPSNQATPADAGRIILELLDEAAILRLKIHEQEGLVDNANRSMRQFADEVTGQLLNAVTRCKALGGSNGGN